MSEQGFNPAAEFLLDMQYVNLFEPVSARPDNMSYRCKGCETIVGAGEREKHFNQHRGIRKRSETMRKARIKRQRQEQAARARAMRKVSA